jgi:hypothetical protein
MNSDSEDDTLKRLKGLTYEEASEMYQKIFVEVSARLGHPIGGVPLFELRPAVDKAFKPYGLTHDLFFKLAAYEGNGS